LILPPARRGYRFTMAAVLASVFRSTPAWSLLPRAQRFPSAASSAFSPATPAPASSGTPMPVIRAQSNLLLRTRLTSRRSRKRGTNRRREWSSCHWQPECLSNLAGDGNAALEAHFPTAFLEFSFG